MFQSRRGVDLRILLFLCLATLAPIAAARDVPINDGVVGKALPINAPDAEYLFTLQSASYALGWFQHEPRVTPTEAEKMLILRYRLQNESSKVQRIDYRDFTITASDSSGTIYDRFGGPRIVGAVTETPITLEPKESVDLYASVIVAADADIGNVTVKANPGLQPALRFGLKGEIEALPGRFSDNGHAVRTPLTASVGETLPIAGFDISVGEFSLSKDPLYRGNGPGAGRVYGVLPMEIVSRYEDDAVRIRKSTFQETVLVDAAGQEIAPYTMLGETGDQAFGTTAKAGDRYAVRLLYWLDENLELSQLRLQSSMPSRTADSYAFNIDLRSEVLRERDAMVQGGSRVPVADIGGMRSRPFVGRFALGVYDPQNQSEISMVDASEAGGVPEARDVPPEDVAAPPETAEPDESAADDLSQYRRDVFLEVNAVNYVGGAQIEKEGDELKFTVISFSGVQGTGNFTMSDATTQWGRDGENWAKEGRLVQLDRPTTVSLGVAPYTVYGYAVLVNEDDKSSSEEVRAMERAMEDEMRRRLRRAFAGPGVLDPVDASLEVQRSHAAGLRWLESNINGGDGQADPILDTFWQIQDDATGGLDDDDDCLGGFVTYWINLPTLSTEEILAEVGITDPTELVSYGLYDHGFMPPGEFWRPLYLVDWGRRERAFFNLAWPTPFRVKNSLSGVEPLVLPLTP